MHNYFCYFIFLVSIISCNSSNQELISSIETTTNSTFAGKTNNMYLFKKEAIVGVPFTETFESYSNIKVYSLTNNEEIILFDTTVFSSNKYSDIRFHEATLDSLTNNTILVFRQCPDGDDSCIYKEYPLNLRSPK